jgi:hypothetical protein
MDLHARSIGTPGVSPYDRVVADDPAGGVIESPDDRIGDLLGDVQLRAQALDLGRVHQLRVDPVQAVDLRAVGHHEHRPVGVGEREVPTLREQQVEVELGRQAFVELDARVIETRALRRLVVRAQDRRVASRGTRAYIALLEHRHVLDAELAEVVRGCESVCAAAHDHHVVGVLQLAWAPPHPSRAEDLTHRLAPGSG